MRTPILYHKKEYRFIYILDILQGTSTIGKKRQMKKRRRITRFAEQQWCEKEAAGEKDIAGLLPWRTDTGK